MFFAKALRKYLLFNKLYLLKFDKIFGGRLKDL